MACEELLCSPPIGLQGVAAQRAAPARDRSAAQDRARQLAGERRVDERVVPLAVGAVQHGDVARRLARVELHLDADAPRR
jgi:hypothetical protein